MTFGPRRLMLLQPIGFGLLFLTLFVLTAGSPLIPAMHAPPGAWPLTIVIALLWLIMLVISVAVLAQVTARITVDEIGISRKGFLIDQHVRWEWIERIDVPETASTSCVLVTRGGKRVEFMLQFIEDTDDLRRLIEAGLRDAHSRIAAPPPPLVYRLRTRGLYWAVVGFIFVFFGAGFAAVAAKDGYGSAIAPMLMTGALLLILVLVGVYGTSQRVILGVCGIERTSAFGSRRVEYADVRGITLMRQVRYSNHGAKHLSEAAVLVGGDKPFRISSQLENYPTLRDELIKRCPGARIEDRRPQEDR